MAQEYQQNFQQKQILVTGGAGFVGSHLVDRLVESKAKVTVVDNLVTGKRDNLNKALENPTCRLLKADASKPVETYTTDTFDYIFHLASPASPVDFERIPKEIYRVNAYGTEALCEYASQTGARILFASTSEAYGDPLEHPQKETYWGNVNPVGARACYDESKRFGEMVMHVYQTQDNLDTRTVRIFNTYGPRMQAEDGRVIPAFVTRALKNEEIVIHGDGEQTRSFCYVDDLVEYLLRVMTTEALRGEIVNIGNAQEYSMNQVAEKVIELTDSESAIVHAPAREGDPAKRRPALEKVIAATGYEPTISFEEGMRRTIDYFRTLG